MFTHSERRQFAYTPRQLFDLVADIEKYPEFIDGFVAARIRHRHGNVIAVDQVVRMAGLRAAFATRAVLDPPQRIVVTSHDFPFRSFEQRWSFTPNGEGGTAVQYDVRLEFRFGVGLVAGLVDQRRLAADTVSAFARRAEQIYGAGGGRRAMRET